MEILPKSLIGEMARNSDDCVSSYLPGETSAAVGTESSVRFELRGCGETLICEAISDSPSAMDKAIRAVKSGALSQYAAAKTYNVPRTSLWERLKGVRRMKPGEQSRKFSAVTKHDFAAHLVKNWDNFNMSSNIVSGFQSSGIYPFDPEAICKAYAEPGAAPFPENVPLMVATVYASQLEKTRSALREIHLLSEAAIENVIQYVVRQAKGFLPAVVPERVAEDWHRSIMGAHNPKTRKLKESRLHAETGLIATDSKVIAALEQRENEKAEKLKKSKKAAPLGLTDVTNTPQKKRFRMSKK
ncbi:uncharacterized protein LOC129589492 [Paramacrobiotus metropolitanus]|uniref:uncharacterized protein LOC129589492 n=1 Tax=Paramacrobiotus metropolitanus TaxID=2943436 RepID=UPI002446524E|nr:uncharacterized protein LOC129589492 [Paramacrobiotus metropolitanus]